MPIIEAATFGLKRDSVGIATEHISEMVPIHPRGPRKLANAVKLVADAFTDSVKPDVPSHAAGNNCRKRTIYTARTSRLNVCHGCRITYAFRTVTNLRPASSHRVQNEHETITKGESNDTRRLALNAWP